MAREELYERERDLPTSNTFFHLAAPTTFVAET